MDHITDLPVSKDGYVGILRVVERLIQFPFLVPVKDLTMPTVMKKLRKHVFSFIGAPAEVQADGAFRSLKAQLMDEMGVHLAVGLPGNARGRSGANVV